MVFLVPPEVKNSMAALLGRSHQALATLDVLKWSMIQTCQSLDALRPLWAHNGLHYRSLINVWDSLMNQAQPSQDVVLQFQEPEARTLEQLYAPWADQRSTRHSLYRCDMDDPQVHELATALYLRTNDPVADFRLDEEQEREVACEVERERQVSRPPRYSPCIHHVDQAVRKFVRDGKIPKDRLPDHVWLAFASLGHSRMNRTSVAQTRYPTYLCPTLLVTEDYMYSVEVGQRHGLTDDFVKPVNRVLSSTRGDEAIILSQYEATSFSLRSESRIVPGSASMLHG